MGGPVWDSDVFLKSVTYRLTLSKFRGGPVKKMPKIDTLDALDDEMTSILNTL